jgi:hypothetical protein
MGVSVETQPHSPTSGPASVGPGGHELSFGGGEPGAEVKDGEVERPGLTCLSRRLKRTNRCLVCQGTRSMDRRKLDS